MTYKLVLSPLFTLSHPCKKLIWLYALLANSSQADNWIFQKEVLTKYLWSAGDTYQVKSPKSFASQNDALA